MSGTAELSAIGGAGLTSNDSIIKGFSTSSMGSTDKRWMSMRVVRCGIKLIPLDNITVKSGLITAGLVPGKT